MLRSGGVGEAVVDNRPFSPRADDAAFLVFSSACTSLLSPGGKKGINLVSVRPSFLREDNAQVGSDMEETTMREPLAKTSELVVKKVGEELLVYDLARHKAHSLNRVAAAVWRACDGSRGVAALGVAASGEAGHPVPPEAIRYALRALEQARLLEGPVDDGGLTRREVMQRLGTAAAAALPIVTTITAPTAAQAASCKNFMDPCSTDAECCGGTPVGVNQISCNPLTTCGCSCTDFKTFGKRCLQQTCPPDP